MPVQKVTATALFFDCPGRDRTCREVSEIPFASISVQVRSDGARWLHLPPCPKCGAQSAVVPGLGKDEVRDLIRRIAWRRAVLAGNFVDEDSRKAAGDVVRIYDEHYVEGAPEEHRRLYEDDTSMVEVKSAATPPQG